jgi:hypothetical protein
MGNQDNQYDVTYRIIETFKMLTKQEITPLAAATAIAAEVEQYAKWKAEKMYSEEEVEQLIHRAVNDSHCRSNRVKHANSNECAAFVHEWVEQFKKK